MAAITNTTTQNTFHRREPNDPLSHAIFDLDVDPSRPGFTRITLPERSTWSPGPHWHERYIEFFKVIQGRVLLTIDGNTTCVTPDSGPQRVDRYAVHDFCRADKHLSDDEKDDGDVVTEEWTDPADGMKHVFFRNAFSTMQDAEKYWGYWTYVQALTTVAEYDNFIEIVPGRFSYIATHGLYAGIRLFAKLTGIRPWLEEYTPAELRDVAMGQGSPKLE